jgi:hypothetical protein
VRLNAKDNVISVENNGNVLPIEVGRSYFGSALTAAVLTGRFVGTRRHSMGGSTAAAACCRSSEVGWAHRALVYIPCCNAERSAPPRQHTLQHTLQPNREPMRTFPLSPLPLSPHSRLSHSCPEPFTVCSTAAQVHSLVRRFDRCDVAANCGAALEPHGPCVVQRDACFIHRHEA